MKNQLKDEFLNELLDVVHDKQTIETAFTILSKLKHPNLIIDDVNKSLVDYHRLNLAEIKRLRDRIKSA